MPACSRNRLTSAAKNASGLELGSAVMPRTPSFTDHRRLLTMIT
jgi:hypothetical protein